MRILRPALTGVLMLLLCHSLLAMARMPQQGQSLAGSFRIAGRVVNAKTGSPLARARVSITDARNAQRTASILTSGDGKFEFSGVPAGKFALEGAARGFIRAAYDQHDQFSTAIVTGAGLDTESLVLGLDPVAVLTGKILDESGEPVRHAAVTVYREDHFSGVSRIRRFRSAQTDDLGTYEVAALDAGTYFVGVKANPWYEVHPRKAQPSGSENSPQSVDPSLDVAYPTTYYGDTTSSDEATPIPVRGGDQLEADIHLNPVPALHLLMQVANDRQGVNMPILRENTFDGSGQNVNAGIQGVSQGLYEVTGIPAGRYSARFINDGQGGAATQVDLTSDGQELAPPKGDAAGIVKATVQVPGEAQLPSPLFIVLRGSKGPMVAGQEVDAQGQVMFGGIAPGKYDVFVGSQGKEYSVARISASGGDTFGHSLNIVPGSPIVITLTLVAGNVNVEGFAKRSGKAAPGVMIALVPQDPENHRDLFRRDQSDLDGSFNLRGVIPGTYKVVAIANGWDLDWAQPAVIAHYAEHGEPVTIDEGSLGTVRLSGVVEVQSR
jgi:hypothetical protein